MILAQKVFVGREETASLNCEVKGNPPPTISWSPCDEGNPFCNNQCLNISQVQSARANYMCTARNRVGRASGTTVLRKCTLLFTCGFAARKFVCKFVSFVAEYELNQNRLINQGEKMQKGNYSSCDQRSTTNEWPFQIKTRKAQYSFTCNETLL